MSLRLWLVFIWCQLVGWIRLISITLAFNHHHYHHHQNLNPHHRNQDNDDQGEEGALLLANGLAQLVHQIEEKRRANIKHQVSSSSSYLIIHRSPQFLPIFINDDRILLIIIRRRKRKQRIGRNHLSSLRRKKQSLNGKLPRFIHIFHIYYSTNRGTCILELLHFFSTPHLCLPLR